MPIVITGQGTLSNGGTALFVSGGNTVSLSSVKVSIDGGTAVEVWKRSVTVTDLVKWNGWSTDGEANSGAEATASATAGYQLVSGTSTGRRNGRVSQSINMVSGHVYWLYFGTYGDTTTVTTPFETFVESGTQNTSRRYTYTASSGSKTVSAVYSGSDNTGSAYGRLCSMNIVDLTAAFGAGNEPTAAWCVSNLGIFNGSKTITP